MTKEELEAIRAEVSRKADTSYVKRLLAHIDSLTADLEQMERVYEEAVAAGARLDTKLDAAIAEMQRISDHEIANLERAEKAERERDEALVDAQKWREPNERRLEEERLRKRNREMHDRAQKAEARVAELEEQIKDAALERAFYD